MMCHLPLQIEKSNRPEMTLGSMTISFHHSLENLKEAQLSVKSLEKLKRAQLSVK
jgi:hypothetical protein